MTTLRADLHVHSRASTQTGNMRFLKSRDCYSSPEDVYRRAKAHGM
jgi:predicted metal-dependent phosphoesterase TrpH